MNYKDTGEVTQDIVGLQPFPRAVLENARMSAQLQIRGPPKVNAGKRPHRYSRGLQISGSRLSPAIRLKHYVQLVNNFLTRAYRCHNFKSRVICNFLFKLMKA